VITAFSVACHLQQLLSRSFAEIINFLRHKVTSVQIISTKWLNQYSLQYLIYRMCIKKSQNARNLEK